MPGDYTGIKVDRAYRDGVEVEERLEETEDEKWAKTINKLIGLITSRGNTCPYIQFGRLIYLAN